MLRKVIGGLVLSLFLATSAQAAENGFYVGLKFLDSIQSTSKIASGGAADFYDTSDYTQNTFGGGIFAGFDFYPASKIPVRAEIEYAIRTNGKSDWGYKYALPTGTTADIKYEWNLQTLFLNAYWDFHNDSAFTPYVGAGVGMAFLDNIVKASYNGVEYLDDHQMNTLLAWNVGVGASYAITDTISADLAYRFVGLGYNEVNGANFSVSNSPYANEFSLGVRFTF